MTLVNASQHCPMVQGGPVYSGENRSKRNRPYPSPAWVFLCYIRRFSLQNLRQCPLPECRYSVVLQSSWMNGLMVTAPGCGPLNLRFISFSGMVQDHCRSFLPSSILLEGFKKSPGDIPHSLVRSEGFWSTMQNRHFSSWNSASSPALAIPYQLDRRVPAFSVFTASLAQITRMD